MSYKLLKLGLTAAAAVLVAAPAWANCNDQQQGSEHAAGSDQNVQGGYGGSGASDSGYGGSGSSSGAAVNNGYGSDTSSQQSGMSSGSSYQGGSGASDQQTGFMGGLGVSGGLSNFTGAAGRQLNAGQFYGVQGEVRPNRPIGVEIGYQGSHNGLSSGSGAVWRNDVEALAKAGPVLGRAHPYVGAGLGATYLHSDSDAQAQGFSQRDIIGELPIAAGLDYNIGRVRAGARADYRFMGGDEFTPGDTGARMLNIGVSLGGNF